MHPILFKIGPVVVRYYGLMYVIAISLGLFLAWRETRRRRLSKRRSAKTREREIAEIERLLMHRYYCPLLEEIRQTISECLFHEDLESRVLQIAEEVASVFPSSTDPRAATATEDDIAGRLRFSLSSFISAPANGKAVPAVDQLPRRLARITARRLSQRQLLVAMGCESQYGETPSPSTARVIAEALDEAIAGFVKREWLHSWNDPLPQQLTQAVNEQLSARFGIEMKDPLFDEDYLLAIGKRVSEQTVFTFEDATDLLLWVIPVALIGARAYYVAFQWSYYGGHLADVFKLWQGGLAIHGGVIAGAMAVFAFSKVKGLSFWRLTDSICPSLILGQAIGRFGNLMNGDAYGLPTDLPWGIRFPADSPAGMAYPGQATHPSMIYEMILNILIFAYLMRIRKRGYGKGFSTAMYFILYSVARSVVSFTRGDSLWLGPIRAAHAISAVLIVAFSGLIIWRKLYHRVKPGSSLQGRIGEQADRR